jgi:hypothetical protein
MIDQIQDIWEKFTNRSRSSAESNKDKDTRKVTFYVDGTIYVHPKEEKEHVVSFYSPGQKVKGGMYLCIDPREVHLTSFPVFMSVRVLIISTSARCSGFEVPYAVPKVHQGRVGWQRL